MNKLIGILCVGVLCALVACVSKESGTSKSASNASFVLPPTMADKSFDISAGQKIVMSGTTKGATACIACHGQTGAGNGDANFPRLASMSRMYLAAQLHAYQSGERDNAIMAPISRSMTDADIENVAAYYESQKSVPYPRLPAATREQMVRGRTLADTGDQTLRLQSCANCHGPGGGGMAPNIPYLKGQFSGYIESQLRAWREGYRKTNPEHMAYISTLLNEADSKTVAAYFQQIPNEEKK